ncbi:hypothetical protein [Agaribacterium sp. ZY112]|uniref:hypothetical protein n=1 Tax=Agaribacterium sp. ZY112 TaxID=3233574 RepID=UPI003525AD7A
MSSSANIEQALDILVPLRQALEAGFWDSNRIDVKDRVFDLVSCVNAELNELAKLSVSDLGMQYETITPNFAASCSKLRQMSENLNDWFLRSDTNNELGEQLIKAAGLLSDCRLS